MERGLHEAEAAARAARREADEWRRQAEAHASELLAWRRLAFGLHVSQAGGPLSSQAAGLCRALA